MKRSSKALVPALLLALASCQSSGTASDGRIKGLDPERSSSIEDAAADLAQADVVFLGEEHDNDVGHAMQLALTQALHQRRPQMIVSMEHFEADVQVFLDAYLAGEIDEELFLAQARPWPNYPEHYRAVVEWAKENGVRVIAANIPRRFARTVAYKGLGTTDYSLNSPYQVHTDEPEYLARFMQAMGGTHGDAPNDGVLRWFAAQCIKDDMMAQSIVQAFEDASLCSAAQPIVVHWCGRFHSDYALGTVSRVALRRPDLDLRVVSMISGGGNERPTPDQLALADYVMQVPDQE